jgi:hypothetical protein
MRRDGNQDTRPAASLGALVMRCLPIIAAGLLLAALAGGAEARPGFLKGGVAGIETAPPGEACGPGAEVCAVHQSGQTFITWNDLDVGSAGNNWRYWVYRSASPITSENYGSAALIADYAFNNSGHLSGGNPDLLGGVTFTQANRQNADNPMVPLSDLGDPLPYGTGLQVYTATGAGNAYYTVVGKPCPNGVCTEGPDVYIGATGAVAESVAPLAPIKIRDSLDRGQTFGRILTPAGKPLYLGLHASSNTGGAAGGGNSRYGDYWVWYVPAEDGYTWNDGTMTTLNVLQNNDGTMAIAMRDTLWAPTGNATIETFWNGIGMTPHSYVGPANRRYIGTANMVRRALNWAIDYYGLDANQLHCSGQSMGAMGCGLTGMRMTDPQFSALWTNQGMFKMYTRSSASWPGAPGWGTWPHRATVAAPPSTLGTVAENVLLPDGNPWGGSGSYSDIPYFVQQNIGDDLPLLYYGANQDDSSIANPDFQWAQQKEMAVAMNAARRGYGFAWTMGNHDHSARAVFACGDSDADQMVCVPRSKLRLNLAYPAFSNSSIDDDWGTGTRNEHGIMDGDSQGGTNIGFQWTIVEDSASAFSFTVENTWMDRNPTPLRQTTTTSAIAASGSGPVTVTDGAALVGTLNSYYLISGGGAGDEIVAGTRSGNTVTITVRARLGTTAKAHNSGATIRQYVKVPTGPNAGPFSTMTVDVTPRRIQGFTQGRTNGQLITCDITPHGEGSSFPQTPTVADGIFTLTAVKINATGVTSIACS